MSLGRPHCGRPSAVSGASGCIGLITSGSAQSLSARYTISPPQKIASP
jgi:hypothetical protein